MARIPPAADTLGGHLIVAANLGWAVPWGQFEHGVSQGNVTRTGPGLSLDIGYGVSRMIAVALWGQGLWSGSVGTCEGCRTTSYAFGPLVRYHLAQGVRFDPWIAAGLGWRLTTVRHNQTDARYSGPEWGRLVVGGDWYPSRFLGLGPFVELNAGVYSDRPANAPVTPTTALSRESGWHWLFVGGLRLVFDTPGK